MQIKNLHQFQLFLQLCARVYGTDYELSRAGQWRWGQQPYHSSVAQYIKASYIIYQLKPYYRKVGKRLIKSPKFYFYDTALACALLGVEEGASAHTLPFGWTT